MYNCLLACRGSSQAEINRPQVQDFRKRVEKLATALGVDRSIQQETHALVEQVLDSWSSGSRMPRAALLAAACVFIVSRLHGLPLTIVNIALEAQVDKSLHHAHTSESWPQRQDTRHTILAKQTLLSWRRERSLFVQ